MPFLLTNPSTRRTCSFSHSTKHNIVHLELHSLITRRRSTVLILHLICKGQKFNLPQESPLCTKPGWQRQVCPPIVLLQRLVVKLQGNDSTHSLTSNIIHRTSKNAILLDILELTNTNGGIVTSIITHLTHALKTFHCIHTYFI